MKATLVGMIAGMGMLAATAGFAGPPQLKPANPQPSGLKSGLSVSYAYPIDVKTLSAARSALNEGAKRGKPLKGLNYADTRQGEKALTSKKEHAVAARIKGYVKFDAPGIYEIEMFTNDGLDMTIGGQKVGYLDERSPCGSAGMKRVEVPQAGWYALSATYFQRLGTSCLQMEMGKQGSKRKQVPNGIFGH
nr:hypothetical protein [uncultured Shimia sp.]